MHFVKNLRIPFLTLLLCLCIPLVRAQRPLFDRISVRQFTDQDGLPQNSIKKVTADASGYIWLATENGLVRFDGHHFNIYDKSNAPLNSNRIYDLKPSVSGGDHDGKMNAVFYAMDETMRYGRIENGRVSEDTIYRSKLRKLPFYQSANARAIEASGLPRYDNEPYYNGYILPMRKSGELFFCTEDSVVFYSQLRRVRKIDFKNSGVWNFMSFRNDLYYINPTRTLTKMDRQGKLSLITFTGDLPRDTAFKRRPETIHYFWNLISDQLFVSLGRNFYLLSPGPDNRMETRLLLNEFDLAKYHINSAHFDQQAQMLFLGSNTDGLFVIKKMPFEAVSLDEPGIDNVFYSQAVSQNGSVITPTGMRIYRDPVTQTVRTEIVPGVKSIYKWDGRGMLTDRDGFVWMKHSNSVFRFDRKGEKVLSRLDLPKDDIKAIYQDPDGLIWLGQETKGLYYIDPGQFPLAVKPWTNSGITKISYIESAGAKKLWVGTRSGMYLVDLVKNSFYKIPGTNGWDIKSIYTGTKNQVWMAVQEQGIALMRDGKLTTFPLDKNGFLRSAHCIMPDSKGFFWIPTNKGLFQVKHSDLMIYADIKTTLTKSNKYGQELFYQYYDKSDGFLINEFNGSCQPCAVKMADGTISLPSLKGLVWFKPDDLKVPAQQSILTVDRLEYNGISHDVTSDTIRLPADPRQIRFFLATPYFGHTNNTQISYHLGALGELPGKNEWEPIPGSNPTIAFSSLISGEYVLNIRKLNGFGLDNYTTRSIRISVAPIWYETWWARLLLLLICLLAVYFYIHLRLRRMKNEKSQLEEKVSERTSELHLAMTELESSKNEVSKQLHLMSLLLASMTHDIQSPLRFIGYTTRLVPEMIEKGMYDDVNEAVTIIGDSSQEMSTLISDLLDYLKANLYGKTLKMDKVNLRSITENKYQLFKNVIEFRENRFENYVPEELIVFSDFQMLSIIIHNLIDNASKFTRGGLIQVTSEDSPMETRLMIRNNGSPLSAGLLEMFNSEAGHSLDNSFTIDGKPGLGLIIIKEVAVLAGIRLKVTQDDHTHFSLIFEKTASRTTF